ncbi:pyridoxamine 5'-phosphate oxidase [Streptomyces sp. C10]|uniref:pyridoxamine 5'-phosphate oxidase n=1 Tax=Streptomyces sp. C10 TaxID=531941 RepID=UPI0039806390
MAEMSGAEDAGGEAGPGATAGVGGSAGSAGAAGVGRAAGPAGQDCPEAIRRALAAHTTMTLAYVDEDGPQACAVLYATGVMAGAEAGGAAAAEAGGPSGGASGAASGVAGAGAVGAGPALYFVTATTTRHGRALVEPGARVAFTAQRDGQEWSGLTGLQGRGRCRPLTGAERAAGWQVYVERFPFVAASDRLRAALERTTLWELRPDWLRLIDNGQGFGHKEEWSGR